MDTKRKTAGGRPPDREGQTRETIYKFRVNEYEKQLLDRGMKPYQWRNFCVLVSQAMQAVDAVNTIEDWETTLYGLDFVKLLADVSENKLGRQDED